MSILVRAKKLCYYNHLRRRVGDVFRIKDEQAFSKIAMVKVPDGTVKEVVTEDVAEPVAMSSPKPASTTAGKAEEVFDDGSDETDASQGLEDIDEEIASTFTMESSSAEMFAECERLGITAPKNANKTKLLELIKKGA